MDESYLKQKGDIIDKYLQIEEDKEKEKNDKFESAQKEKIANYLSRLESQYQLELQRAKENDDKKLELQKAHLDEVYRINITNADLLGLDVTNIENKYLQDKEALEDAARERKKLKKKNYNKI